MPTTREAPTSTDHRRECEKSQPHPPSMATNEVCSPQLPAHPTTDEPIPPPAPLPATPALANAHSEPSRVQGSKKLRYADTQPRQRRTTMTCSAHPRSRPC